MSKWIDDAFNKASAGTGHEADIFLACIDRILGSYEHSAGGEKYEKVLGILKESREMREFAGLCFGAGMVEARKLMLQDLPD